MKRAAFACLACLLLAPQARAGTILVFGQNAPGSPVAFVGGGGSSQSIVAADVPVEITSLGGVAVTPIDALFRMNATSTGPAAVDGTDVSQQFGGSFSITAGGLNYLSGTWTGGQFHGTQGGDSGALNVSDPPNSVGFTSDVLPANELGLPRAFSIAFADVSPALAVVPGGNLGDHHASIAFTSSAAISEPGSLVLLGLGGPIAFCVARLIRRRRAALA